MRLLLKGVLGLACFSVFTTSPDLDGAPGRRADQERLKPFSGLVGDWRGVGQPRRGSNKGSWSELATWTWKLSKESAALELKIDKGKYLTRAVLRPSSKNADTFFLSAKLADGSDREFTGRFDQERKTLILIADAGEGVRRITLTTLHDARSLILLESREADGSFSRIAEVGYTRKGVAFAAGESFPLCVVTDGKGTIPLKYKGETYYVCCSGCKELFDADPAGVLAEMKPRREASKK
ncbi:MAG: hypothetical protein NVSMB14_09680 [Isosphaeraceae bacterium]